MFKEMYKKQGMMKFVCTILILMIPLIGFPFPAFSSGNAGDSSRTATIVKKTGNLLTVDKGELDGVQTGMIGMLRFPYKSIDGSTYYSSRGLFEVVKVYRQSSVVRVKILPDDESILKAVGVLFQDELVAKVIQEYSPLPPTTTTGKTTDKDAPSPELAKNEGKQTKEETKDTPGSIDNYITIQTVEYSGKGEQYRSRTLTATSLEKKIHDDQGVADYKLWTMGQIMEPEIEDSKFQYGPIEFSRKLDNEKVDFKTEGFDLVRQVLNQVIDQVGKDNYKSGAWQETVTLDLAGEYLPQQIKYDMFSKSVEISSECSVSIIKYVSEPFEFKLGDNEKPSIINARSAGIAVYSPEKTQLYQYTSTFEAYYEGEALFIEELGYLSDGEAKPILKLLDVRQEFLLREPLKVETPGTLPIWALQSIKAQQIVNTAGLVSGERGTNPAPLLIPVTVIAADLAIELITGKSFSDHFREWLLNQSNLSGAERELYDAILKFLIPDAKSLMLSLAFPYLSPFSKKAIDIYDEASSILSAYQLISDLYDLMLYGMFSRLQPFKWPKPVPLPEATPQTTPVEAPPQAQHTTPEITTTTTTTGGLGWLTETILIAGGAAGAGYLAYKVLGLDDFDITGTWSITFRSKRYQMSLTGDKTGGDIKWGINSLHNWPNFKVTGSYGVDENKTVRLTLAIYADNGGNTFYNYYYETWVSSFVGEFVDKNNMEGTYTIVITSNYSGSSTKRGSWSASR